MRQKVDQLLKVIYGIKSEKMDPAQLQLLLQGLEPEKPESPSGNNNEEPEGDKKQNGQPKKKTKGKNNSRLQGWDELETIEETIFPEGYEANKDQLELIDQEARCEDLEQLEHPTFLPASSSGATFDQSSVAKMTAPSPH